MSLKVNDYFYHPQALHVIRRVNSMVNTTLPTRNHDSIIVEYLDSMSLNQWRKHPCFLRDIALQFLSVAPSRVPRGISENINHVLMAMRSFQALSPATILNGRTHLA